MKRILLTGLACAALAACNTVPGPPPPPSEVAQGPAPQFLAQDFAWSAERGSGAIRGEVNFRQDGKAYSCAAQPVILTPDTAYSRWRITALYGSADSAAVSVTEVRSRQAARPSDDYSAFVRRTTCDAQDKFSFQGLPAGGWFIIVVAPPTGGGDPMALMRHVDTKRSTTRAVVIQ